jgi:hypothetical protein
VNTRRGARNTKRAQAIENGIIQSHSRRKPEQMC